MSEFIGGYVLYFKDGGEPEEQVIVHGSHEDCARTLDLLPAVSYSGSRPVDRCVAVIVAVASVSDGREDGR